VEAGSDFDLLAASLRADATDLRAFLEALAAKLEASFPDRVRIDRGGLLGGKRVRKVAVDLGANRYEVEQDGGRVSTRRCTVVRGIALKNEELTLEEWIGALGRALGDAAAESEQDRAALARLLDA
jgi:hypothetical protein